MRTLEYRSEDPLRTRLHPLHCFTIMLINPGPYPVGGPSSSKTQVFLDLVAVCGIQIPRLANSDGIYQTTRIPMVCPREALAVALASFRAFIRRASFDRLNCLPCRRTIESETVPRCTVPALLSFQIAEVKIRHCHITVKQRPLRQVSRSNRATIDSSLTSTLLSLHSHLHSSASSSTPGLCILSTG